MIWIISILSSAIVGLIIGWLHARSLRKQVQKCFEENKEIIAMLGASHPGYARTRIAWNADGKEVICDGRCLNCELFETIHCPDNQ